MLASGLLIAGGALALAAQEPGEARGRAWRESPYRNFGPERVLSPGVLLRDEASDPSLRQTLADELARLSTRLFVEQGWPIPFAAGDPLTIFVSRRHSDGVRRLVAGGSEGRRLVSPAIEIDATGLSDPEIVREAGRLFALAAISGYGVPDKSFLTDAAAEFLSGNSDSQAANEATWIAAAAPTLRLADQARTIGPTLLEEFSAAAGGPGALRLVWERASERGQAPLESLADVYAERTGGRTEALLLRSAARLYAAIEPEPGPSSVGLYDLQAGSLDASEPAAWTLRHRVYIPEDGGALRFQWPAGAGAAVAIVRYRDPELAPDFLFLEPDTAHRLSSSGVARVDFVVAGSDATETAPRAPVFFETVDAYPIEGLLAHAAASADGSRISWTTAAHDGLAGWAVIREEVRPDGQIARTDPQIVPASTQAEESFRYAYLDSTTRPGTFYRYSVWAVTEDGLLAKAFSATLRVPE